MIASAILFMPNFIGASYLVGSLHIRLCRYDPAIDPDHPRVNLLRHSGLYTKLEGVDHELARSSLIYMLAREG
jgi:hypothetical protein